MMPTGVVIDANSFNLVLAEIKQALPTPGPLQALFQDILDRWGLAWDKFIEAEWTGVAQQQATIWVAEIAKEGKLCILDNSKGDNQIREMLRSKCGLPRDSRDFRYVACAKRVKPHYVLTQDMDLYDPRQKKGTSVAKKQARQNRQGTLCKFVKKELGVKIGCFCHCVNDLSLDPSLNPSILPGCHSS